MKKAKKKKIALLTTGGTIEKIYDEVKGHLLNTTSVLEEGFLKYLRYQHLEFDITHLMSKDSLEMTKKDREKILEKLEEKAKLPLPVIILHGTDTLEQTAAYCDECLKKSGLKLVYPVVFTGAMRPRAVEGSDALQNITESIFAASLLPPGIFLCFHGQVYESPHFKKDKEKGVFSGRSFEWKKS